MDYSKQHNLFLKIRTFVVKFWSVILGEGVYGVLVGKPDRKRPLGRPRRRWVNDIRMDLQEVGCG